MNYKLFIIMKPQAQGYIDFTYLCIVMLRLRKFGYDSIYLHVAFRNPSR